ncbi:MAG: hypothetical protein AMS24_02240 [Chlamydiae bacterium SM23_39]|nr:MAG: hypothetical protein AMS24_02240 [Chlamydiae bacterium SM23_39]
MKIFLPKLGESILSATVVRWFKKVGDKVEKDEPLLEVTTEKVTSEIPSPVEGVLKEIIAFENSEVKVGEVLAEIAEEEKFFVSPAVKRLAEEKNISLEELKKIKAEGRITKKDVEEFASDKKYVEMSFMRKAIAKNMELANNIPTGYLITEVDVTSLLKFIQEKRKKIKDRLTITSFIIKAIADSVLSFKYLNSFFKEGKIFLNEEVNVGIAVDTEEGLFVPVIKSCDKKTVLEIAKDVSVIAQKARDKKLEIKDMEGGTITISNFGMGGAKIGIPLIKIPEVAIIGVGAIMDKVVFKEDKFLSIKIVNISLSLDHRVIDGMYGSNFLKKIKNFLESEEFYGGDAF